MIQRLDPDRSIDNAQDLAEAQASTQKTAAFEVFTLRRVFNT